MKAVLENGNYKAVVEPTSINYYCWREDYYFDYVWTLSETPNNNDYAYLSPNPQGLGNNPNLVAGYNSGDNTITVITNFGIHSGIYDRYIEGDTTYTGTNYKLINQ